MLKAKLSRGRVAAIKVTLLVSCFLAMLNETSINVALTALMDRFGVGVSTAQWLVTGFMLVMAAIVPMTAYIVQSLKGRSIYFCALCLLVAGGLAAGLAPSFGLLLAGRLVQAAGTCLLMLLTINSVLLLSGSGGTGGAMGLVGLVALFAPAIAPSLSGLVLQFLGWRWIFLGPSALFVAAGAVAFFVLENLAEVSRRPLDLPSVLLEAIGFGGLLYGVSGLGDLAGPSGAVHIAAIALGLAALALFAARQRRLEEPLLDLRIFRYKMFSLAMVAVFFCVMTLFGLNVLMPMLYVQGLGMATAAAGLAMLPGGLMNGLTSPFFGRLYDRSGPRAPVICGTIVLAACALAFALAPAGTPLWRLIALHVLCLVALSLASTASQGNGMASVPPELYPHGTAIMSTLMQLGGGFGSALYTAFYAAASRGAKGADAAYAGFHGAFALGAAFLAVPLVAAFFVRKAPPLGAPGRSAAG
jgi:DHA2 family lincomycin resistance protein-like MFS transporter